MAQEKTKRRPSRRSRRARAHRRTPRPLLLLLTVLLVVGLGLVVVRWTARERIARAAHERALAHLAAGDAEDALAALLGLDRTGLAPDTRERLTDADLAARCALWDLLGVYQLYERAPSRVLASEEGSLLAARAAIGLGRSASCEQIRAAWRGKEGRRDLWLLLDADALAATGRPREAQRLLDRTELRAEMEAERIGRLARLSLADDPELSLAFLQEAVRLSPERPGLIAIRAEALEALGRPIEAERALREALALAPRDPGTRDALAELLRRQGRFVEAMETLWGGASERPEDGHLVKATCLSLVAVPKPVLRGSAPAPASLAEALAFLRALGPHRFWDADAWSGVRRAPQLERVFPDLVLLQLLDQLAQGREAEALAALRQGRGLEAVLSPTHRAALVQLLALRTEGRFPGLDAHAPAEPPSHPLLGALHEASKERGDESALPKPLRRLVRSEVALPLALAACGYLEAASRLLPPLARLPERSPDWAAFGIAQTLRLTRGEAEALAFIERQEESLLLTLVRGELLLVTGRVADGEALLAPLAMANSPVGYRAAFVLARHHLDGGRPDQARRVAQESPLLRDSPAGRELMGEAAFLEGDLARADRIYEAIAGASPAAQAYLARRAFARGDLDEALSRTEDLALRCPDAPELARNRALIRGLLDD